MTRRSAHAVVALVATVALVLQLVLVIDGRAVLDQTDPPGLAARLLQFVSYFTILSNLMVAVVSARLALGHDLDTRLWRVLRLTGLVSITVTGVIHFLLLRDLLDLGGADLLADTLLHRVVPPLAVLVWVAVGPRDRISRADVAGSLVFPLLYPVWTLIHGLARGFWPYPFTDVDALGLGRVLVNGIGVLILIAALSLAAQGMDRQLSRR